MPLTLEQIHHLQKVWIQEIENKTIEGNLEDIISTKRFGTVEPGGYYYKVSGGKIKTEKYVSTAHVLEVLYPPWKKRREIETQGILTPEGYVLEQGDEAWIYNKNTNTVVYKNPPYTDRETGSLLDVPLPRELWVYYVSDDPRLPAFVTIHMKRIMEQEKLPIEIRVNADTERKIINNGVIQRERHMTALRIPEGYYLTITGKLAEFRRKSKIVSTASYKEIVDSKYRKDGDFIYKTIFL